MKTRKNTYRVVTTLPKSALKVSEYVAIKEHDQPYLYKKWRKYLAGELAIDFEIVLFHGNNFVLPKPPVHKRV